MEIEISLNGAHKFKREGGKKKKKGCEGEGASSATWIFLYYLGTLFEGKKKCSASHSRCSWTVCNLVWRDWMLRFHHHWNPRAPCLAASVSRNSAMNMFQREKARMKEKERKGVREEGVNLDNLLGCWVAHRIQERKQCSRDVAREMADVFSRENNNSLAQNSSCGWTVKFE